MADGQKLLMVVDGDETPITANGISQATSSSMVQSPALSAAIESSSLTSSQSSQSCGRPGASSVPQERHQSVPASYG